MLNYCEIVLYKISVLWLLLFFFCMSLEKEGKMVIRKEVKGRKRILRKER